MDTGFPLGWWDLSRELNHFPDQSFSLRVLFMFYRSLSISCIWNPSLRFFFFSKTRLPEWEPFPFFCFKSFVFHLERNKQKWSFKRLKFRIFLYSLVQWFSKLLFSRALPPSVLLKNICLFLAAWGLSEAWLRGSLVAVGGLVPESWNPSSPTRDGTRVHKIRRNWILGPWNHQGSVPLYTLNCEIKKNSSKESSLNIYWW